MREGYSLHVGVAFLSCDNPLLPICPDPAYGADLAAAAMQDIATRCGLRQPPAGTSWFGGLLQNQHATVANLRACFGWIRDRLRADDLFMLTLAGHGIVYQDEKGEDEQYDQAFVLYDEPLLDDAIYQMLSTIHVEARVVVVADACCSGSLITTSLDGFRVAHELRERGVHDPRVLTPRETFQWYRTARWRAYASSIPKVERPPITADALLLAAASDVKPARTGTPQLPPPFTTALLNTWARSGTYEDLYANIKSQLQPDWQPVLNTKLVKNPAFLHQRPFSI